MDKITAIFGFIFIFIALIVFLALKRWLYSWEGTLKDKVIEEERDVNIDEGDYSPRHNQRFILIFETSDGKILRLKVNARRFKSTIIGCRYVKAKKSWKFKKCN